MIMSHDWLTQLHTTCYSAVLSGGVVHGCGGDKNGGKGGDQSGTGVKV